jgi:subtilisin family serine protease
MFTAILATLTLAGPVAFPAPPDYVPGDVLVTFRTAVTDADTLHAATNRHAAITRQYRWLSAKRNQKSVLMHSESKTTPELIADLLRDPRVETAEPNYLRHISATYSPNDPRYGDLWGLHNTGQTVNGVAGTSGVDIGFPQAWALASPSTNEVVVTVIDTGCDYRHPDLASNMWCNPGEIPGNGLDDDGNGYVDDYHGFDFASTTNATPGQDADPMDVAEHGTHVCGTIAATGSNAVGVIGVNFHARIMILKASGDGINLANSAVLAAYDYAAMMKTRGVNVVAVNASYGGGGSNTTESTAISELGNLGIVFCAAAGNSSANNDTTPEYPGSYTLSNIIAVAATDQNDALASFSSYGATSVDLAAPGVNILSCMPTLSPLLSTTASVRRGPTNYTAVGLSYAGVTTGITATAYNCAYGASGSFPAGVSGNIALIQRGPSTNALTFFEKLTNAMAAGAIAAVIYNNVAGNFTGTLQTAATAWIPAVSLSQTNGQALAAAAPTTITVVNQVDPTAIYQYMNGTSMATPHVAGAVAFLALNFPEESVTQRIQRILSSVTLVPSLTGKVKSKGRLNILKAIDTDSDGLPDWWERRYFGGYTNANPGADGNSNGVSNLNEWLTGASPTYLGAILSPLPPEPASTNLVIRWSSETGNLYRVERSTNLLMGSGGFVPISGDVAASPPSNTYTDTAPTAAQTHFYRVELQP